MASPAYASSQADLLRAVADSHAELARLAAEMRAARAAPATAGPGGLSAKEWKAAQLDVLREQRRAARDQLGEASRVLAYRASGQAPPEMAAAQQQAQAQQQQALARGAYTMGMRAPGIAGQLMTLDRAANGNQMAGVGRAGTLLQSTLGGLPGPIGVAANLLGSLGQVIAEAGEHTKEFRASLQEVIQTLREHEGTTNRVRQTGLPSAGDLRTAFGGTDVLERLQRFRPRRPGEAQLPGLPLGVAPLSPQERLDVFRQERDRAQAEMRAMNPGQLGAAQGRVQRMLRGLRDDARNTTWIGNAGYRSRAQQGQTNINQVLRAAGIDLATLPAEFRNLLNRTTVQGWSDRQIREMAEAATTGRYQQARSRFNVANAVVRSGIVPNLTPGAPQLQDMPSMFRNRQTDVLDIHGQVQQEVIRDQREEARFQAQMDLWREILGAIQNPNAAFQAPNFLGGGPNQLELAEE